MKNRHYLWIKMYRLLFVVHFLRREERTSKARAKSFDWWWNRTVQETITSILRQPTAVGLVMMLVHFTPLRFSVEGYTVLSVGAAGFVPPMPLINPGPAINQSVAARWRVIISTSLTCPSARMFLNRGICSRIIDMAFWEMRWPSSPR